MRPIAEHPPRKKINQINNNARMCPRSCPCELFLFGFRIIPALVFLSASELSAWTRRRRRTNVWREVTSPARAATLTMLAQRREGMSQDARLSGIGRLASVHLVTGALVCVLAALGFAYGGPLDWSPHI